MKNSLYQPNFYVSHEIDFLLYFFFFLVKYDDAQKGRSPLK